VEKTQSGKVKSDFSNLLGNPAHTAGFQLSHQLRLLLLYT